MPARRPIALLLALLALALVVAGPAAAAGPCTPGDGWGADDARAARIVVGLVNLHRLDHRIPQLAADPALTRAASWKSLHMARYRYFDHDDPAPPVARSPFRRMADCGFTRSQSMGENIAAGQRTPASVMAAWLASPGHRENIERRGFRLIGVGVARRAASPYGIYWTQDFGGASSPGGRPPAARPDAARTAPGAAVLVDVRANDGDPDGDALAVLRAGGARHGRVAVVRGHVRYTPAAGFVGTDTVRYVVLDARGMVARGRVTVRVG